MQVGARSRRWCDLRRPRIVPGRRSCKREHDPAAACYRASVVLERVALHQTRFRMPGVAPDGRGVVLGERGLILFPSLDRLVAFLRAYSDDASLDELLPSLDIERVRTPMRTREVTLSVQAESSYRMDRVAGIARLVGGLVFTGTQRHYVKYRDAASPLGYDVQELVDEPADLILYHDHFRQTYSLERRIAFRELLFKLTPQRLPPAERAAPSPLLVTAEPGPGAVLIGYLFRRRVRARAALAEWPSESAFVDGPRRLYLFQVQNAPRRVVELLDSLPGAHVFEPLTEGVAVELGYRHPVSLESCASLFEGDTLSLFRGDGDVTQIAPVPPFADVASLVDMETPVEEALDGPEAGTRAPAGADEFELEVLGGEPRGERAGAPTLSLPLRLATSHEPWRAVVATLVPSAQREWLARLLYVLPPRTLASLRMAVGEDRFYLVDARGIEGVPLGTFFTEVADRIYVPAGMTLVPSVGRDVLDTLVAERGDGHVFFDPDTEVPWLVPGSAFGPVSRRVLRDIAGVTVHADRPPDTDPPLPSLQYDRPRRFPLWGVSAAHESGSADGVEEGS